MATMDEVYRDLAVANRILAREGVVDAYGHVSVRHPEDPERYILSRSLSPAMVTPSDLMEFNLEGEALNGDDRTGYGERPIHGAIYEARPDVQAVVHNHSHEVIPFTVTNVPLRPIIHMGTGIGQNVPVWDIRTNFGETNMLVLKMNQGRDLAQCLGTGRVALMRGHGCVVVGPNLKEAVMVAIYLEVNAGLQAKALQMGEVTYLSPEEERLYGEIHFSSLSMDRAWSYFLDRADLTGI
jgi:HCOMODA/2-hydroxy-3-carboxy-muconic semialdehyde decarboxylase